MNSFINERHFKWAIGILLCIVIATVSYFLGQLFPIIGAVIFALLIGMLLRNVMPISSKSQQGVSFVVKSVLKLAIILLGATLSVQSIVSIGMQSIFVILLVVIGGIAITLAVGKLFNIESTLSLLIGSGTSICGATAISVVKGVVSAKESITAYAISTIFLFNIIATLVYPWIARMVELTPLQIGIWIGSAIHDTSSVVAVGFLLGDEIGEIATTVKLVRTLFILPLVLAIIFILVRKTKDEPVHYKQAFPIFIIGFVLMSVLYSFGIISDSVSAIFGQIAKFLVIIVMAGVGLQVDWRKFTELGSKPLLVGMIASLFVAIISFTYVWFFV